MVNALNVGNSILARAFTENIDITPMKLQKMIYFVYRGYLKETKIPLFNERFEVWKYGSVIPSVYANFKHYGANAIKTYATENDGRTVLIVNEDSSPSFKKVMGRVWDNCKRLDGIYLSSLTHNVGTAWHRAYESHNLYLLDADILAEEEAF